MPEHDLSASQPLALFTQPLLHRQHATAVMFAAFAFSEVGNLLLLRPTVAVGLADGTPASGPHVDVVSSAAADGAAGGAAVSEPRAGVAPSATVEATQARVSRVLRRGRSYRSDAVVSRCEAAQGL